MSSKVIESSKVKTNKKSRSSTTRYLRNSQGNTPYFRTLKVATYSRCIIRKNKRKKLEKLEKKREKPK